MTRTEHDPTLNDLRKNESLLVISATGTILFGLWSIMRAGVYFFLNPFRIEKYVDRADLAQLEILGEKAGISFITNHLNTLIMVTLFAALVIDLLFRLYAGLSGWAYGRGKKKGTFYTIVVWIMVISMGLSMLIPLITTVIDFFLALKADPDLTNDAVARGLQASSVSILVDITSFLALFELAVSSMEVRKLRKKLGVTPVSKGETKQPCEYETGDFDRPLTEGLSGVKGE